ncbi:MULTISPECIES: DUF2142 domain-containing protein [unclassified Cellulomonas]|uniref:DUF2142 domain-containing protein n=1 Tax=unclassified Cellulomonas TaxID=2620175 RepID=UPI0024B7969B|nr:DUF2142 domain-containing protein [Cellulomonas sp. ES6]WHP17205.1 DUF2142 domain-containing protein [Cellulomonas sp. ES6]
MPDRMPPRTASTPAPGRRTSRLQQVVDRVPGGWRWTGVGLLLLALTACWSVATPLMSSPDEPSHVVRAAGVVRGQVSLELHEPQSGAAAPGLAGLVELPSDYAASVNLPNCFAFQPTQSADCQQDLPPADGTVVVETFAGQYPPLYYALVGWPSLLLPADAGIMAMRLVSALLTSVLVTWGLVRLTRIEGNRGGIWGASVALTPMCLFLGATVNPSGFEIAAAFTFWTACLALVLDRRPVPTSALVQAVVGGGLLVTTRSSGPVWALAIVVVALVAAPAGRWRAVLRHPRIWWFAGATAVACALGAGWLLTHPAVVTTHDAYPHLADLRAAVLGVLGFGSQYLLNMIGDFGWLDAPSPPVTVIAWYAATGAVLLVALGARRAARTRVALVLLVLGTAAAPLALQVPTAADTGLIWQGRYALPIAVGVPLLAGLLASAAPAGEADLVRRLARATLPVVVVGQVAAFYWGSRRYAEGADGDLITLHPDWQSPISYLPGVALYGAVAVALGLCAWAYLRPLPEPAADVAPAPPAGHGAAQAAPAVGG